MFEFSENRLRVILSTMIVNFVKIFLPSVIAFVIGIGVTPLITHYLYRNKMWKKKAGKIGLDGKETTVFNELHKNKEVGTPKMGGIVIWLSTFLTVIVVYVLGKVLGIDFFEKLDFFSRNQTWIPLSALIIGSLVGLFDDFLDVRGSRDYISGGLSLKKRLLVVSFIALVCALWFYLKLGVSSIGLPVVGAFEIGWLFVPLFIIVTLGIYSGGVIDGIDGLAGGVFAAMFGAYAVIAFYQSQVDMAALSATIVGSILAFLWFNIPPARFYMSDTGTMGLTLAIGTIAFMTDNLGGGVGIAVLPIIGFLLVATVASDILQLIWKKVLGRKLLRIAPLHHHFEAIGWPGPKVVMRYWVLSVVFAFAGVILAIAAISS